jgi:hypothetical protein
MRQAAEVTTPYGLQRSIAPDVAIRVLRMFRYPNRSRRVVAPRKLQVGNRLHVVAAVGRYPDVRRFKRV